MHGVGQQQQGLFEENLLRFSLADVMLDGTLACIALFPIKAGE